MRAGWGAGGLCGAGGGLGSFDVFKNYGLPENVELVARQAPEKFTLHAAAGVILDE